MPEVDFIWEILPQGSRQPYAESVEFESSKYTH